MKHPSTPRAGLLRRIRCRTVLPSLAVSLSLGPFLSDAPLWPLWAQEPVQEAESVRVTMSVRDAASNVPLLLLSVAWVRGSLSGPVRPRFSSRRLPS